MVEGAIVSTIIQKLLPEATLIVEFRDEFNDLTEDFKYFGACLNEVHKGREKKEIVQTWSMDLQDIVYDTEDILEKCESRMASGNYVTRMYYRWKMGRKVREVKKRIGKIKERYGNPNFIRTYTPPEIPGDIPHNLRLPPLDEPKTVGMEENVRVVSHWLSEESHVRIMAVVSMGGTGKTLLLRRIRDKMRPMFEVCVWLTVSRNFSVKELQNKIGRELKIDRVENVTVEEARSSIFDHLRGKRSLLILDDVWDGRDLLDKIGIPEHASCRVIISTRDENVARAMGATQIHPMPLLSEDDSWRLFCIFAFPQSEGVPPPELEEVAQAIVRKCARVPLAIKTIAGSMAARRATPNEWNDALHSFHGLQEERGVMPILQLSYDDLPSSIQLCFLYCSAFPEDRKIDCDYLIELWIAEGFVQTKPDLNSPAAVDIGRSYLNQLVSRCLLEPSNVGEDGRVEYCRMHDLLRDLALDKASKNLKCFFRSGKDMQEFPLQDCTDRRRVSLMETDIAAMPPIKRELRPLRALFLSSNFNLREIHLERLKSLRILDLSSTSITQLPKSLKRLEHLRLLNLSRSLIEELPESIGHLEHLQYIDLSRCMNLLKLPSAIGALKLLRYLNLSECLRIEVMPEEISHLTSLETLILPVSYELMPGHHLRFEHLQRLENLRQLEVTMGRFSRAIPEHVFGNMGKMRRLRLWMYNDGPSSLHLPEDMKGMCELEKLNLHGFVPPTWLYTYHNLVDLALCRCECRMYPRLDSLPNLSLLFLKDNGECSEFPEEFGRANGFPNLERLEIQLFPKLKGLPELENGAMPKLKSLRVYECPQVMGIPGGLENVESLVMLMVLGCPRAEERLREGGEDEVRLKSKLPHLTILTPKLPH